MKQNCVLIDRRLPSPVEYSDRDSFREPALQYPPSFYRHNGVPGTLRCIRFAITLALLVSAGFASAFSVFTSPAKVQVSPKAKQSTEPMYVITAHNVVHDESTNSQLDNYVIVYGSEVLRVQYAESQISTVKPGASELAQVAPGKNLHLHSRYRSWPQEPDVSQVPRIGAPIRACEMDTKYSDGDGHPVIAIQSVSSPCMSRNGDTLHYAIAPNGGIKTFDYVNFDILSETVATTKK